MKNHTSKIICSDSCFYRLVWNIEVCSIYNCSLEPLTSMRECKLTVDRYPCLLKPSNEAMSNNARTAKNLCRVYYMYSCYDGDLPKAILRQFWRTRSISTVYFADVICWFSMFWKVFTYSKFRNDNLPDLKCSLKFFQRYSWTPDQVWFFFCMVVLSDVRPLYTHTF